MAIIISHRHITPTAFILRTLHRKLQPLWQSPRSNKAVFSRPFRLFDPPRRFERIAKNTRTNTHPQTILTLLSKRLTRFSALLRLLADDAAEEFPGHESQDHADEVFVFGLFGELEGGLEGLFCEEDGGGGGDGGGDEVEGCLDLAVGVAEGKVFDEGEEGGEGVVEGVGGGADYEEGVEGCEEGDVEVGV